MGRPNANAALFSRIKQGLACPEDSESSLAKSEVEFPEGSRFDQHNASALDVAPSLRLF